jgi:hypothetical protein
MIIIIILLLILLITLYITNKEKFESNNKNKWIVLLTMCVKPNQQDRNPNDDIDEIIKYRKELYTKVIKNWLTYTDLPIFVVESSNYNFDEIKHDRLKVFSFEGEPLPNSSVAEAKSILYALDKLKDCNEDYTHVLKVTGKYYLNGIIQTLSLLPDDYDIYTQQHINHEWRQTNTEYYGIKKDLYYEFANTCGYNMESHMYNFSENKKVIKFPQTFSNDIKRNDGNAISNL